MSENVKFDNLDVQILHDVVNKFLPDIGPMRTLKIAMDQLFPVLDKDEDMRKSIRSAFDEIVTRWGDKPDEHI